MIDKNIVKKIAHHIFHPYKKEFIDNNLMHPEREWSIGLIFGIVLVLTGGLWSVNSYFLYSDVSIENVEFDASESFVYRASVVEEVLKNFSERKKNYDSLLPKIDEVNQVMPNVLPEATSTSEILPSEILTEIAPYIQLENLPVGINATKTESVTTEVPVNVEPVMTGE